MSSKKVIMKKLLRNFIVFAGAWIAAMTIFTLSYGVKNYSYIMLYYTAPALFLGSIGAILGLFENEFRNTKKINWIIIIGLLAIDQIIKNVLFAMDWHTLKIAIIDPVFYIIPTQNTQGSYLWVLLNLQNVAIWAHVIFVILLSFILFEYWRFYSSIKGVSFWSRGFLHLFLVGAAANVIDNVFYGGSLDYITIQPFYTFDLKDLFITLAELFALIEIIDQKAYKNTKQLDGFNLFLKSDIKSWFKKNKDISN